FKYPPPWLMYPRRAARYRDATALPTFAAPHRQQRRQQVRQAGAISISCCELHRPHRGRVGRVVLRQPQHFHSPAEQDEVISCGYTATPCSTVVAWLFMPPAP